MSLILPSRYMMPELLIPNRKPVGPVEIDWTNPLSRGLIGFWMMDERDKLFNVASQKHDLGLVENSNGSMSIESDAKLGRFARPNLIDEDLGTSDYYSIPDAEVPDSFRNGDTISLVAVVRRTSNVQQNNWPYLIALSQDSTSEYSLGVHGDTFQLWIRLAGTRVYLTTTPLALDKWYLAVGTYDSGSSDTNVMVVELDSQKFDIVNSGAVTGTKATNGAFSLMTNVGAPANRNWNGDLAYAGLYERVISPEEVKQLGKNLTQFLKPKGGVY